MSLRRTLHQTRHNVYSMYAMSTDVNSKIINSLHASLNYDVAGSELAKENI